MKQTRNTVAKTEILKLITESQKALSHSELHKALNNLCDRVTVYRVLDRLLSEGLIHKIANKDGVVKYAICHNCNSSNHHHNHIHFSCEICNTITCIEDVEPSFKLSSEYKVKDVNFTVSGICPKCA